MALGSQLFRLLCIAVIIPGYCSKISLAWERLEEYAVDWQALYMNASLDELLVYLEEASA